MDSQKPYECDRQRESFTCDLSVDQVVEMVNSLEYVRLPKLLHGFWERIYHLCEGDVSFQKLKQSIELEESPSTEVGYDFPPQPSEYFNVFGRAGVDSHYLQIIEMMQEEKDDLVWGVCSEGFPGISHNADDAQVALQEFFPKKSYDGTFWKVVSATGEIEKLWEAIGKYDVVVVGMQHLKDINKKLQFSNFHYFPVRMPLCKYRDNFVSEWKSYHSQFKGRPVVYLMQTSIAGAWATGMTQLPECFVFDMGRALDLWVPEEKRPNQPWFKKAKVDYGKERSRTVNLFL